MDFHQTIAVIGGGPIGLETAIYARSQGFSVILFERGEIGQNILDWGHIRLFSPWKLNVSDLGMKLLQDNDSDFSVPDESECPTGHEYVNAYLKPIANLPLLNNSIFENTEVVAIGKNDIFKNQWIGHPERLNHPFRILVRHKDESEEFYFADIVIDTSGVYGNHNWIGNGGIPAIGEQKWKERIVYTLPDIAGKEKELYTNKKTLLIGDGYSAATVGLAFQQLIKEFPGTSLTWTVNHNREKPYEQIYDDPLPERATLIEHTNEIITGGFPGIQFWRQTSIEAVDFSEAENIFTVKLYKEGKEKVVEIDHIIANVGYSPDNSIYRELQFHECWASRGPMKLSAALLNSAPDVDCLAQESYGADTLKNPEPNFYIIGSKSYGKNSTFLIKLGLEQIQDVFSLISVETPA